LARGPGWGDAPFVGAAQSAEGRPRLAAGLRAETALPPDCGGARQAARRGAACVSGAGIMIGMSTPEDPSLTALRAAYEAERAALQALEIEIAAMAERNRRLDHLVKELRQALYGRKSEKLTADERQLAFEDVETAVAEMETAPAGASP
jgi:hypothetical protein